MTRTLKPLINLLIVVSLLSGSAIFSAKSVFGKTFENAVVPGALQDRFVTVEGLRVHYIEAGIGPTVVLLHGNAGSVEDFKYGALDVLVPAYRVVAIDRSGHGSSDRPPGKHATVEFQADLLYRTLSSLEITKPVLVGHSWGAALALAYALKYPNNVSGLVLLAPAAYPDNGGKRLLRAMVTTPAIGDVGLFLARRSVARSILRRALVQAFYPEAPSDSYMKHAMSLWLGRKQLKAAIEDEWSLNDSLKRMSQQYGEINLPVVLVTGDQDRVVAPDQNARTLHAVIPRSHLIEIKDTGHEIPQTHPESIETALRLIVYNGINDRAIDNQQIAAN